MTVLTTSESIESLQDMAKGLVERYRSADQPPPRLLDADCDCCRAGSSGTRLNELFDGWPDTTVLVYLWNWMRRIARGVVTTAHSLYAVFMSRLSACLLDWEAADLAALENAKRAEIRAATGTEQ